MDVEQFATPGALRSRSSKARALHVEAKSDDLVSDTVEDAPARPRRSYGFCQHGLDWYIVDPRGLRIGDAIKTAVQAKRLARQLTEASLRGTDRR